MCKAFSCIITKNKKVYWKLNIDSHEELIKKAKLIDNTCDQNKIQFARVEISPQNNNYLSPNKWVFKIDESITPIWFSPAHKEACLKAFRIYKKQLYKILIRNKKIIHPFKDIKFKGEVTEKHKLLLKTWDSVRDSVWDSVWGSVGGSVGGSVRGSVWDSVGDSVWGSVRDSVWDSVWGSVGGSVRGSVWDSVRGSVRGSVWGYLGSFFRVERKQWKYTNNIKTDVYPFQSAVDLWNMGLVPSFDGNMWRLHAGKKAKIVFSITQEELKNYKE